MSFIESDIYRANLPPTRRSYFGWLLGICTAGVGAVLSIPLIRFALYPLRSQTTQIKWSDAGAASDLASSTGPVQRSITVEQIDGWRKTISEKIVYVVNKPGAGLQVLSAVCPHLGCSVQWRETKQKFECPCHTAVFSADGSRLTGPSPRGMDSLQIRVENGRVLVRYQYFRQLVPNKEVIG